LFINENIVELFVFVTISQELSPALGLAGPTFPVNKLHGGTTNLTFYLFRIRRHHRESENPIAVVVTDDATSRQRHHIPPHLGKHYLRSGELQCEFYASPEVLESSAVGWPNFVRLGNHGTLQFTKPEKCR